MEPCPAMKLSILEENRQSSQKFTHRSRKFLAVLKFWNSMYIRIDCKLHSAQGSKLGFSCHYKREIDHIMVDTQNLDETKSNDHTFELQGLQEFYFVLFLVQKLGTRRLMVKYSPFSEQ